MVRSSFSILFFIRESKARKSDKAPIELMITVNGERCAFSTGKRVKSCNWDKAKQQVKGKDEEAQSLNSYLKAIKAKLYQKEAELLDRGFIITAELLRDAYFDKVESLKEKRNKKKKSLSSRSSQTQMGPQDFGVCSLQQTQNQSHEKRPFNE